MSKDQRALSTAVHKYFEAVYERYHRPSILQADPLEIVHRFPTAEDRELAALVGALLAYGTVAQIKGSLTRLFSLLGENPSELVHHATFQELRRQLRSFRHRFHDGDDIAALLFLFARTKRQFGSLESALLAFDTGDDYGTALEGLLSLWYEMCQATMQLSRFVERQSFRHLVTSPARGGASKRWFLFLRWAVRPADGIDLGLWKRAVPCKLLFPVDSHILRIARNLGITSASQASLQVAREITAFFRRIDAQDPVRFDFALCHLGILGVCPTTPDVRACEQCELAPVCQLRQTLASASRRH
ncbi:MAG: TIGR02757 family protein [Candidatus Sumerlaeaceae bacterium]|nr:TIGR02757 family protein [Candidatus Sumerlaeaceae bacterium]